jgi:hypothetical protein
MATNHRPRTTPPMGANADRPPVLTLELKRRCLTLLLANILPLIIVTVVMIGVAQGKWTLKPGASHGLVPLLMILGSCIVLVISTWIIQPMGRWLRDRPRWHFRHGHRVVWALPYAIGWCAWMACWLAGIAAAIGALAMIGMCLVRLVHVWGVGSPG